MRLVYPALAPHVGLDERKLERYGRHLREGGFIGPGRPGRGGHYPASTPHAVAALLLGLMEGKPAVDAPGIVDRLSRMQCKKAVRGAGTADGVRLARAGQFLDALAQVIAALRDDPDGTLKELDVRVGLKSDPRNRVEGLIVVGSGAEQQFYRYRGDEGSVSETGLIREVYLNSAALHELADLTAAEQS